MLSDSNSRVALAPVEWFNRSTLPIMRHLARVKITKGPRYNFADLGYSARTLFGFFSPLLNNPATPKLFVKPNGNDNTGTGSAGAPFASIWKAITVVNASGIPSIIEVGEGTYHRNTGFFGPAGQGVPTVDMAIVADGRVVVTTSDDTVAWAADATYTNCYSVALGTVERGVDLKNRSAFGDYADLTWTPSAAVCNRTPNSIAYEGGKVYCNRADGAPVTVANTRLYRTADNVKVSTPLNIFIGGNRQTDGFDFEGGYLAPVRYIPTALPTEMKAFVVEGATAKYAGGPSNQGNGFSCMSIHGLAAYFRCHASANASDGFSINNALNAACAPHMITVNCTGYDNGRWNFQSCNGWTSHHGCWGADFCGVYDYNHGGTMRSIDQTISWLAGTIIRNDQGDTALGGIMLPAAVRVDGTAVYYCDGVEIDMPNGTLELSTSNSAYIYTRNMLTTRAVRGNVSSY